jgi:hypothetical protein
MDKPIILISIIRLCFLLVSYLTLRFVTPGQIIFRLRATMMIAEHQVRGDERTCITLDEQAKELLFG